MTGPKKSKYYRIPIHNLHLCDTILTKIFGRIMVVQKQRILFLLNNIRFHLDSVDELGEFLEIEYVLSPNESREAATKAVNRLINRLRIQQNALIDCSYAELLSKSSRTASTLF